MASYKIEWRKATSNYLQLLGKALLVGRFQQAGAEGAMNFDCTSDDTMEQLGEFHASSFWHAAEDSKKFPISASRPSALTGEIPVFSHRICGI